MLSGILGSCQVLRSLWDFLAQLDYLFDEISLRNFFSRIYHYVTQENMLTLSGV